MGYIYIIRTINYDINVYKIIKTDGNYNVPVNMELINKFYMVNETLAGQYLMSILSKFKYNNNEFYKCPIEWLEMACQYVQRKVNRDDNIMDLDLPWLIYTSENIYSGMH